MKKWSNFSFSEKQLGYLFILPALVIITVIAIWPVARSFWISMYDVRLNDPAKTQMHSKYAIDMERYVGTAPILLRAVAKEQSGAEGEVKEKLDSIHTEILALNQLLNNEEIVAERYEAVDSLLYDFKPVPDELKYAEINNDTAREIKSGLSQVESEIEQMKEQLVRSNDVIGLIRGYHASFVDPNYVGLDHYKYYFTDKRMWNSLWNTIVFTVLSVSVELVAGLCVALLINKAFIGRGLVRAAILIPWATPTAIAALMWQYLYDGQNGIIAKLFSELGFISEMGVLLSTKSGAMFSIIFADIWKTTPFMALLLLAGLQTINGSLYEAAEVDGANKRQKFFKITLPLLQSTILVALLFRTLDAFRVFDLIYVLTGGGPANATESISIYAYKTMFAQMNFGAGSALSVIVFLCIAVISTLYIRFLGSDIMGRGEKEGA